jgi:DNA helicase-2/ATP-dependent DNA helicase PcrA
MTEIDCTPEIVLGPPGSGKTTEVLRMVDEDLTAGVPPDRIGLITFTRMGANEAAERACAKFKMDRKQLRWFRTIHSLCFAACGSTAGDVLEGKKIVEFGDWLGVRLSESVSMDEGSTFGYEPGDRALFMENLARVRCIPLRQQFDENDDNLPWPLVDRVSRGLARFKNDRGLVDYTDMLQMFVDGDWTPVLDRLYVDEAQDLSQLQWRVVFKLARGVWARGGRVVIVGDDDQSLYLWSGADLNQFVTMPGRARVLGQSWRVPRAPQRLAEAIIGQVHNRRPKQWAPRDAEGIVSRIRSTHELDAHDGEDILILGRNAYVLRPVMEWLRREGAIFEWRGHGSVSKPVLEAVTAWETLRAGKEVSIDEARAAYVYLASGTGVKRGYKQLSNFGPEEIVTMNDLVERGGLLHSGIWHESLTRIPDEERAYILRARQKGEKLRKRARIRVSTIHGAKGGQAGHVVLFRDMASRTYAEMDRSPEDEHRVWYVAATRVREKLTIVAPKTRQQYDI